MPLPERRSAIDRCRLASEPGSSTHSGWPLAAGVRCLNADGARGPAPGERHSLGPGRRKRQHDMIAKLGLEWLEHFGLDA